MTGLIGALKQDHIEAGQKYLVTHEDYRLATGLWGRLWLRFRMYIAYPVMLTRHCRGDQAPGVRVVLTNPFFAPYLAARNRRSPPLPLVQWVYDLYPDVLVTAGKLTPHSPFTRMIEARVRDTFRRCAANVFLGDRLLAHAQKRFGEIHQARVIAIGADGLPFENNPPGPRKNGRPLRLLYCGNLGRMHDIQTLATLLSDPTWQLPAKIQWQFRAHGLNYRKLSRVLSRQPPHPDIELDLGPSLAEPDWLDTMRDAEVALVTLAPGAERLVMPSKTYSAMVAGQAILAICAPESDLADLIRKHDCGWVVTPGDVVGLRVVLEGMVRNPAEVLAKRHRAFEAGHQCYDVRGLVKEWVAVFGEVEH